MALSVDPYDDGCPSRELLEIVGSKWTTLIVGRLEHGALRFTELQRSVAGISLKMLAQTLRHLERDGLVHREVFPDTPPRVEYRLTRAGESLAGPLASVRDWAQSHVHGVLQAREKFARARPARSSVPPRGRRRGT
jgi:DNA-binding HxlR family transcriptional regulator